MADKTHIPPEAPGAASKPAGGEEAPKFGLTAAMALIVGSIIGVGIFNLPTSLAVYGPITLVSMALTTVGALALALLFAALSRRLPADGGPYAYARAAFGNPLGFANAWSYWITAWAGNAAIAVGWVLYVEHFINTEHNRALSIVLVLIGLWLPALINLTGVRNMGWVQLVSAVLKFADFTKTRPTVAMNSSGTIFSTVKTICVTAMFRSPDRLTRAGIHSPVNAMTIDQPTWCSVFTNTST